MLMSLLLKSPLDKVIIRLTSNKRSEKWFLQHTVSKLNHFFCMLIGISNGSFSQLGSRNGAIGGSQWPKKVVKKTAIFSQLSIHCSRLVLV